MHPARLFIVGGLPGAGKSTRALELAGRFGAVRMCPDEWMRRLDIDIRDTAARARLEMLQGDLADELLRLGGSVVVEWGTWARSERESLRARGRSAGALVHLEFLDPPLDVLWDRIRRREPRIGTPTITRADLDEWSSVVERPTPDEFATYDPMPSVVAGDRAGSPAYPYGSWRPQGRPR